MAKELSDDLSIILDGGPTPGGLPSTIVDARGLQPMLIREGIVPWERVLQSLA
jgi:L-threonylcarbamoyladenylate synthase